MAKSTGLKAYVLPVRYVKYGMTHEDWADLYEAQNGRCAICDETSPKRALSIDHDHETGAIRGLLCGLCNSMLGMAKDSPARLVRAIGYLRDAAAREARESD